MHPVWFPSFIWHPNPPPIPPAPEPPPPIPPNASGSQEVAFQEQNPLQLPCANPIHFGSQNPPLSEKESFLQLQKLDTLPQETELVLFPQIANGLNSHLPPLGL